VVFNKLYFPHVAPATGTLLAFASFGIGFVARPLGGLFFGYFGDRIGRKNVLIATLLLVGRATLLVGCIPPYAMIGAAAPILLVAMRLVQGFGVGGEYGGAVIYAVEHPPAGKRGWFGSWSPMGVSLGTLLAAAAFVAVSTLPEPQFLSWGWRAPFWLSAVLVMIGLYLRMRLSESPVFERAKEAQGRATHAAQARAEDPAAQLRGGDRRAVCRERTELPVPHLERQLPGRHAGLLTH
jgi:MFS family permease